MKSHKPLPTRMNLIRQPYVIKTQYLSRNQLCDEYLDEPETRRAELRTNFARYTDFSERSICGAEKPGYKSSTQFAPQLRTSQKSTLTTEKHTPRTLRGVRVIQRLLAIQNSCKRTTLTLTDCTIHFLAKIQTLTLYSCAQRFALAAGGRGRRGLRAGKT